LQLVDLASEQMLMQPLPDQPTWDEARLVAHVDELIAAQEAQGVDHKSPSKKQRLAAKEYKKQSTSVFNPSTVWFGKTPIVLREDTATHTYYTFCRRHQFCGRHCRKDIQINRPNRDTVIRNWCETTAFFLIWLCASHIFHCILQVMALTLTLTCL
jgi:hypothetical protein